MILTKNQTRLFHAMSDIDGEYIEEAFSSASRPVIHILKRVSVVAATFILLLSIPYLSNFFTALFSPSTTIIDSSPVDSYFFITAKADDGRGKTVKLNENFFKSTFEFFSSENVSIENRPHFEFYISLPNQNSNYYSVSVSYNGTVISEDDEHIEFLNVTNSEDDSQYILVSGWFEEPTDVTVTLIETHTGAAVQEQVLHVEYDSSKKSYVITVIKNQVVINYFVSDAVRNMTTEEIIDSFLREEYLMSLGLTSTTTHYHAVIVENNPETWLELQTRKDAGSLLLDKLKELKNQPAAEEDIIYHPFRVNVIEHLLTMEVYYKQLSLAEKAEAIELIGYDFTN